jgi:ubiquinone/menaquinone biosynthesis C-methylase UbiE
MSSYVDKHAGLYDLFYADKSYEEEAAFVANRLKEAGISPPARLLELACGTARHAIAFEKMGFNVVGVDSSSDMLVCAQTRCNAIGSKVELVHQDMISLDIPGAPVDAATCLFDSIGYLQTNEAIGRALLAIRRHLRVGGALVLEFWHAAAMLRGYDPVRVRRWQVDGREVIRISETSLDPARQLAHVAYDILELREGELVSRIRETQTNRYFLVQEMESLLQHAGFEVLRCYDGFSNDTAVGLNTWHVVTIARLRSS